MRQGVTELGPNTRASVGTLPCHGHAGITNVANSRGLSAFRPRTLKRRFVTHGVVFDEDVSISPAFRGWQFQRR